VSRKSIDQLADIPSNCVRALGTLAPATLRDWAERAGQRFVQVDLSAARDKKAVLTAIGRAFGFPEWYGANLDALYDCLTDLPADRAAEGYVVVLQRLPYNEGFDVEQRDALLDVFRDAAEAYADDGIAMRVFYSS
jgi:RNAse (barnase) inhibitor barstar